MRFTRNSLPFAVAMAISAAAAARPPAAQPPLSIVEWRRPQIALHAAPGSPPEMHARETLPPQVDVTEIRNPYLRFIDPRTHLAWYVSQFDVRTNALTAPVPPADNANETCRQYGPQGMASNCR